MPAVENINVPTYLITSESGHAVHARESFPAYMRLGTEQKWLEVHGPNKEACMYAPESVQRQIAFFHRVFMMGTDPFPRPRSPAPPSQGIRKPATPVSASPTRATVYTLNAVENRTV